MADRPPVDAAARKRLVRDLVLTAAVFVIVVGSFLAYTRTWPPALVVSSDSMQHGIESSLGTADTGDIVLLQAVEGRGDVVTYLEGRASGYRTYGDYGDVIAFVFPLDNASIAIHRALAFAVWNASARGYDIPDLDLLPLSEWAAWDTNNVSTVRPYGLSRFEVRNAGWASGATLRVNLTLGSRTLVVGTGQTGFLTLGDNNVYRTLTKVDRWIVPLDTIVGRARGEIPWFGLLRLVLAPDPGGCCDGWGSTDPVRGASATSWFALDGSVTLLASVVIGGIGVKVYLKRNPMGLPRLRKGLGRLRFWRWGREDAPTERPPRAP